MRFSLLVIILLFFAPSLGNAQNAPTARALYDQGKFQDALALIEKDGLKGAADYYNAGNCLFKLGRLGHALAYYEKANGLAPGNTDIAYNLELTKEELRKAGALPKSRSFWTGWFVPFSKSFSEVWVNLVLTIATALVAWLAFRARKQGLKLRQALSETRFATALGLWVICVALATATSVAQSTRLAAIVSENGVVRSGPSETFTELIRVPAGSKVEVLDDSREGWQQIRFSLGNVGWIMEKDLLLL